MNKPANNPAISAEQRKEAVEWVDDWLAHTEEGLNSDDGTWSPEEKKGLEDDRGILLTLRSALEQLPILNKRLSLIDAYMGDQTEIRFALNASDSDIIKEE